MVCAEALQRVCSMNKKRWPVVLLGLVGLALIGQLVRTSPAPLTSPDHIAGILRDDAQNAGYARVLGPRAFEFPRDHAAHPNYRHEWWYLTGHLEAADGTRQAFN
jgi:predicted secreted hydrolase